MQLPPENPIDAGLLKRGAPLDLLSSSDADCSRCLRVTTQDRYRTMMEGYGGFGAPFFVTAFTKRQSTSGKIGRKSEWSFCRSCHAFRPLDQNARDVAGRLGLPEGF